MKKQLTVTTRWQYYVANIVGLLILVALLVWGVYSALTAVQGFTFASWALWFGVGAFALLPFAVISFFSSMKTVVVTSKGLVISYVFQKHENTFAFSDVKQINSNRKPNETAAGPAALSDSFSLTLNDGRMFSFTRSQFKEYNKLRAVVHQSVKRWQNSGDRVDLADE